MSETPTNRTPEVVSLPNGTCSVDTCVGRTVFASPAPAPGLQAAEARAAEAEAQVAMLRVELDEAGRELSYERQMRQQTEEAMIKLATQC